MMHAAPGSRGRLKGIFMEYNKAIRDMLPGDSVEGFYVLSDIQVKRTAQGKCFLSASLSDASGRIEAKLWDFNGGASESDNGRVVKIRGEVGEYRGTAQLTISRIRFADEQDHYDVTDLAPSAPINAEEMLSDVKALVTSIEDPDYRRLAEAMLSRHEERFAMIPAAKSVHHGFLSGLLMHTGNMLRLADALAAQYAEVIDRSLLLTGTLLHDFAKEQEFQFSPLGLATDYSVKGDLLGHLVMGAMEVSQVAQELDIPEDKAMLVLHMLLSHHGDPQFGAAVVPKCAEAELLSLIDMIDSRMEIYAEAFETTPAGKFSPRIFALDKRIYNHG